jgi:hypothetical protein
MLSLAEHFEELLGQVGPDSQRLALAKALPPIVRDHLAQDDDFKTVDPDTLLIGSYDRHTAIGDLKDVDVLVFVDPDGEELGPRSVLTNLKKSLGNMPGVTRVDLTSQRRSVRVDLEDYDFTLDVVPALIPETLDDPLLVPDRVDDEWLSSHPLGYAERLTEIDRLSGRKIRPTIRLFKHWRGVHMVYRRPKSYLVEVLTGDQMARLDLSGKGQGETFWMAMDAVCSRCQDAYETEGAVPRILDPMVRCSIASQWDRTSFVAFMDRLSQSRDWAEKALAMPAEKHQNAVALWQRVFGDAFPGYVEKCPYCEGERMRAAQAAGTLVVSHGASPRISIGRSPSATPVDPKARSWREGDAE